jgi:DNA polymerase-3 subunit gamma/tau
MCKNILSERSLDVAEIDAASNNGVENIRDLREEVKYLPNQGQYKVYIIDEVHMLSNSAFNALLKTLEEPPPHVIFILATTDPQKIPPTILSRCQRYDFRRISAADMTAALRGYLDSPFEDAALDYIVYHSDGAMRDALSLLDQCLSVGDGLSLEKVRDLLGAVDKARLFEFTDALAAMDSAAVMGIITGAMNDGCDVGQFAADLVRHFRDVLVAGLTDGGEFSVDTAAKLKEQAARVNGETLMKFINAFSEALREMRFAPHMRTAFEVCALKLCVPQQETVIQATPPTPSSPPTAPSYHSKWAVFCKKLPPSIRFMCAQCAVEEADGMLKIYASDETTRSILNGKQSIIRESLAEFFKLATPPSLAIELREAYNKAVSEPVTDDWASFGQVMMSDEEF